MKIPPFLNNASFYSNPSYFSAILITKLEKAKPTTFGSQTIHLELKNKIVYEKACNFHSRLFILHRGSNKTTSLFFLSQCFNLCKWFSKTKGKALPKAKRTHKNNHSSKLLIWKVKTLLFSEHSGGEFM